MKTPIVDFVRQYATSQAVRFHMPGHKGRAYLGCEALDITEIGGADVLYSAKGIIKESEDNASLLFGTAHSFYSTEGSTLAIKAMLAIVAEKDGYILAARNVHKSFVYACALLDIDVEWLYPREFHHLCSCRITADDVKRALKSAEKRPCALYLTSPDYLGEILDIAEIAKICGEYDVPLLVDNAHGAYLAFCEENTHPIALGATMCADSAHKTLPVLTGGAYLHISKKAPREYLEKASSKLSLFASTSPSYLVLQSLDLCNKTLAEDYKDRLHECIACVDALKARLADIGFSLLVSEPLKLVIEAKKIGYRGEELAEYLRGEGIELEFYDGDNIVAMLTPDNDDGDLERLYVALSRLEKRGEIKEEALAPSRPENALSLREAIFAESEVVDVSLSLGRICASPSVSCPPAVPIVMSGEVIGDAEIELLKKYNTNTIEVVK